MDILLTGEQFSAAEALRIGLVNKVVPAAEVMREARRYAEVICENGPLAVQAVKRSVLAGPRPPPPPAPREGEGNRAPAPPAPEGEEGPQGGQAEREAGLQG